MSRYAEADYQLHWPRSLFVQEATRLLSKPSRPRWDDAATLLLEDAFVSGMNGGPLDEFRALPALTTDPWASAAASIAAMTNQLTLRQQFLRTLMKDADQLRDDSSHRRSYWSERTAGTNPRRPSSFDAVVKQFVALVHDLDVRGYFEKRFKKDCVDAPSQVDPAAVIEDETGIAQVWPVRADRIGQSRDFFFTVVEVLHDLVARPDSRHWHDFAQCGWHHSDFSIEVGRAVYRWQVNQLLDRSVLGYRVAEIGEDAGLLVASTDEARSELVNRMVARNDGEVADQVRHAIALFRERGADKQAKRSAVVALSNVLEERRQLIKAELVKKDEVALFEIANRFGIRHQDMAQHRDYDPAFLDWIFWWYLATIELTDQIAARSSQA